MRDQSYRYSMQKISSSINFYDSKVYSTPFKLCLDTVNSQNGALFLSHPNIVSTTIRNYFISRNIYTFSLGTLSQNIKHSFSVRQQVAHRGIDSDAMVCALCMVLLYRQNCANVKSINLVSV